MIKATSFSQACSVLVVMSFLGDYCLAAATLRLEVGQQGTATVILTLDNPKAPKPSAAAASPAAESYVATVVLPFRLSDNYRLDKGDKVAVGVLSKGSDYSIVGVLVTSTEEKVEITFRRAFTIREEAHGRVKLQCNLSFQFLETHKSLLSQPGTIFDFEITIRLPRTYQVDTLAFEPGKSKWSAISDGREYALPSSATSQPNSTVYIAFPSPFSSDLLLIQILVNFAVAFVLLIFEHHYVLDRKLQLKWVSVGATVSLLACIAIAYYVINGAKVQEFLAWGAGFSLMLVATPFICGWTIYGMLNDAELFGPVTLGEDLAQAINITVYSIDENGNRVREAKTEVGTDGRYRVFVRCRREKKTIEVEASGSGAKEPKASQRYEIHAREKFPIEKIEVERRKITPQMPVGVKS